MTIALWCILVAALIPYAFTVAAKTARYDNRHPRVYLDGLDGWRQRAHWVQLNGYEAFPPFAAGVLVAHVAGAPQGAADLLAVTFCIARIVYGLLYLANKAAMRSLVWFIGICAVVGLFVISA